MREVVLAEWSRPNGHLLRFKLHKYQGKLRLDLREYYPAGDEWKPTPKGINLPASAANELFKSAERAVELIERLGRRKRKKRVERK
jgi:hypothetical protein